MVALAARHESRALLAQEPCLGAFTSSLSKPRLFPLSWRSFVWGTRSTHSSINNVEHMVDQEEKRIRADQKAEKSEKAEKSIRKLCVPFPP